MRVRKVVLIGARLSTNLGGPSLLVSTKMVLSNVFPNAEYTLFVPPTDYESDINLAPRYDVSVAPFYCNKWVLLLAFLRRCTRVLFGSASAKATIRILEQADIIVDIFGIMFTDKLGGKTFRSRMAGGRTSLISKVLGKPVIKYTSSLGPFNYKWNRIFAKVYLGHFTDLILARDDASCREVKQLGIKTPVFTVPDTAFLLPVYESRESQRYAALHRDSPLIGLSVSFQARNRVSHSVNYVAIMVDFVHYLIVKYGARVVVLPNELSKTTNDDCRIAEEICAKVNNDHCDMLYTDNLLAQEIKGVIKQCEAIVASRYHTIVAALSLGIPTLAIGWHHKYAGVLRLFNQERRLCNIEELKFEDLVDKFEALWNERDHVRKTITGFLPDVQERILAGAKEAYAIGSAKSN